MEINMTSLSWCLHGANETKGMGDVANGVPDQMPLLMRER